MPTNDPDKVIKGSEFSTEFTAIQTAFGLAAPAASPTFTGTVTIASVDINGGAIDGTTIGGTTPAAGTFSSLTATTADINGGTIDGVTIGGSSAGAGSFTTLTTSGAVTHNGGTANGVAYLNGSKVLTTGSALTFDGTDFATTGGVVLNNSQYYYGKNAAGSAVRLMGINSGNVNYIGAIDSGPTDAIYGAASTFTNQAWYVGGSEQMRLTSTGLGIGTSSPDTVLHTYGGFPTATIERNAGTGAAASLGLTNSTNSGFLVTGSDTAFTIAASTAVTAGTGLSERLRIDSSGNLLVSKSAVGFSNVGFESRTTGEVYITADGVQPLVLNRKTSDGNLAIFSKDGTTVGSIGSEAGGFLSIGNADTGLSFLGSIDAIGPYSPSAVDGRDAAIDLGTTTRRFKDLYLSGDAFSGEFKATQGAAASGFSFDASGSAASAANMFCPAGFTLAFGTNNSEAARITSAGDVLVGKTSDNPNTQGVQAYSNGILAVSKDGGRPLYVNRNNSDGALVDFVKDGTTVGSIGSFSGSKVYIGSPSSAGAVFATNGVMPVTDGSLDDNAHDLGQSSARWKDLYLSGGVYLGGTGAANKLEDYEEGTFSGTIDGTTYSGEYVKVGKLVTVSFSYNTSSATNNRIAVVPFAATGAVSTGNQGQTITRSTSATHPVGTYAAVFSTTSNVYAYNYSAVTLGTPSAGAGNVQFSYYTNS